MVLAPVPTAEASLAPPDGEGYTEEVAADERS